MRSRHVPVCSKRNVLRSSLTFAESPGDLTPGRHDMIAELVFGIQVVRTGEDMYVHKYFSV